MIPVTFAPAREKAIASIVHECNIVARIGHADSAAWRESVRRIVEAAEQIDLSGDADQ